MSPDLVPNTVIAHLRKVAIREGIVGGTQAARERMKQELHNFTVDNLGLPARKTQEIKRLLFHRGEILQAVHITQNVRQITAGRALKIFVELKRGMTEDSKHLPPLLTTGF